MSFLGLEKKTQGKNENGIREDPLLLIWSTVSVELYSTGSGILNLA